MSPGDLLAQDTPVFLVKAEGEGADATITMEGRVAVLDIHSRSGIGLVTVDPQSGPLPDKLVVRLHVKGLEELRLSYGRTVVIARVSSSDSRNIVQRVDSPGGDEGLITPDSPRWMALTMASDQAVPRIPLEQGHFEMTLPNDVLGQGPRSFSIRWIDFYR